jgi:hypothetical protein
MPLRPRRRWRLDLRSRRKFDPDKMASLKPVQPEGRVACYLPTGRQGAPERLQCVVAIGIVQPGEPYPFDMGRIAQTMQAPQLSPGLQGALAVGWR